MNKMKRLLIILGLFVSIVGYSQTKLSDLPAGSTITDASIFPYVESGTTYKATWALIKSLITIPYVDITSTEVKIGNGAGTTETGSNNNIVGQNAGNNANGSVNSLFGYYTGSNLTGSYNDFSGSNAGSSCTGSYNSGHGNNSCTGLTGSFCSANGNSTFAAATCSYATANGGSAGGSSTSDYGNYYGYACGLSATGTRPNFYGAFCGFKNFGSNNALFGDSAAYFSTASYWTIFGNRNFTTLNVDTFIGNNVAVFGYGNNSTDSSISNIGVFGNNMTIAYGNGFYFGNEYDTITSYGVHKCDSGDYTIYDNGVIIGTTDLQGTVQDSNSDLVIDDTIDVSGNIDVHGAIENTETDIVEINGTHTEFVYGGDDAGYTLPLTLNTFAKVTNATNSQFSQDNNNTLTIVGDSVTVAATGHYKVQYNLSVLASAATDCNLTFQILKNGSTQVGEFYYSSMFNGAANRTTIIISGIFSLTASDYFELQVKNTTNSDDMIISTGLLEVIKM